MRRSFDPASPKMRVAPAPRAAIIAAVMRFVRMPTGRGDDEARHHAAVDRHPRRPGDGARFRAGRRGLGYHHLGAPDHVLGVNVASRPDWGARNTSKDFFHDPFVMFGFLSACTRTIEFSTQVMILAQRQTALVAKQAASLDVLSGGPLPVWHRRRLEPGRIRRPERELPQPRQAVGGAGGGAARAVGRAARHVQRPMAHHRRCRHQSAADRGAIPLWFGGHEDVTLRRIARWGDGWIMLAHPVGPGCECRVRQAARLRQGGRTGSERDRPGGLGLDRRRRPRGLAQAVPGLEGRGRHAHHRQQHVSPGSAQAHRRHEHDRSPRGDDAVSRGRSRSHLIDGDAARKASPGTARSAKSLKRWRERRDLNPRPPA